MIKVFKSYGKITVVDLEREVIALFKAGELLELHTDNFKERCKLINGYEFRQAGTAIKKYIAAYQEQVNGQEEELEEEIERPRVSFFVGNKGFDDWAKEGYELEIDYIDGQYKLTNLKNKKYVFFPCKETLIDCVKYSRPGKKAIADECYPGCVLLDGSEVIALETMFGVQDDEILEEWTGYKEEPGVSCTRCGDGGCPSCRPSWFF